jgi:DNA-binding transcriptional ArsR family regulator
MPRAATTSDPFNAIAEPRRRRLIEVLARAPDQAVSELIAGLGLRQPAVSKHLGVLRKVGLVSVSKRGQQRLYRLNGEGLKTVHDWVKTFEDLWAHQLGRIKERAETKARQRSDSKKLPQSKGRS